MNITEKPEKSIVYGVYGGQEGFIVFIEKTEAERLANACDAICRAKTWGEFRDLVWAETYEDIAGDEEWWSYEDFLEFGELEDGEEARLEYEKFEERVPLDKDPFDSSKSVGGYWDGVYFQVWPKGMMVDWVPESIQKKFGKLGPWGGPVNPAPLHPDILEKSFQIFQPLSFFPLIFIDQSVNFAQSLADSEPGSVRIITEEPL